MLTVDSVGLYPLRRIDVSWHRNNSLEGIDEDWSRSARVCNVGTRYSCIHSGSCTSGGGHTFWHGDGSVRRGGTECESFHQEQREWSRARGHDGLSRLLQRPEFAAWSL